MLKFREKCLNVAVSLRNSAVRRYSPARSGRPAVKRFARQPSALRLRCSDGVAAWGISAKITHGRRVPSMLLSGQPSALRSRCSDGVAAWCISAENACARCVPPVHSPGLSALSGPHYSIAAGEGSEPAEERQEACWPQGGANVCGGASACIEMCRPFVLSGSFLPQVAAAGQGLDESFHFQFEEQSAQAVDGHVGFDGQPVDVFAFGAA